MLATMIDKAPARRSTSQIAILAAVLIPLLAATVGLSMWMWGQLGDTGMDASGYVALVLGVLAATVLGVGLMGLVFYSNRRGYDARAGSDQRENPDA